MTTVETADSSVFERRESVARSYSRSFPVTFTGGRGSLLRDESGRDYIDFLAGCSSLNYGHNDPDMKAALIAHLEGDGIAHGLDLQTTAKGAFLDVFERLILEPRGLDYRVQFTGPTGTNAVEAAMKLARKVTGRTNIVAFTNGFHGVTMGALTATGNSGHRGGAAMPLSGVTRIPYEGSLGQQTDTAEMLEAMLANPGSGVDAPAAIMLETVQGEGGLNAASLDWLRRIEQIARAHGALLIVDDIQAGCGRTGTFFSFEPAGIRPDLVTLAKSFSGFGLPMAALLIKPEHDIWKPAEHNGTFRGNTHAFVTARVALEKFWSDDGFARAVQKKGDYLGQRLETIAALVPGGRVKGRGMMRGFDAGSGDLAAQVCAACFEKGLVIETSGAYDEVVKVLVALTVEEDVLARGLDILEAAVREAVTAQQIAAE